jgi:hypothetical protein
LCGRQMSPMERGVLVVIGIWCTIGTPIAALKLSLECDQ